LQNVIKLCSGLKSQGFVKEAEELEQNLLIYKQAEALCYDVSNEKGEDLINSAHPKGSHKLSDVDSDEAVVEDILDKHKKIVDIINKTPKGKLSSAKEILDAVKTAMNKDGSRPLAR
jgi:hypothetical protein